MFVREITENIRFLKKVGPKTASLLEKLGIKTIADLLYYLPRDYDDRRIITPIKKTIHMDRACIKATVTAHDIIGSSRKQALKVFVQDKSGTAALVCFGRNFLARTFVVGKTFYIAGSFSFRFGEIQTTSFDFESADKPDLSSFQRIIPVYPLTEGITQTILINITTQALEKYGIGVSNELPDGIMEKHRLPDKKTALRDIHFPQTPEALEKAQILLKYEELFYLLLVMKQQALTRKISRTIRKPVAGRFKEQLLARLGFSLTDDQAKVVREIENDLFSPHPMVRLLEGDVGSGKTLAGVLACLAVIEAGEQAAFMAPTELLARQHAETIARLVEPLGVRTAFLSGSIDTASRRHLREALMSNDIDFIIGTHALFSEDISFKKLGLVIIDEQHRFGVLQREKLMDKGAAPDMLMMTATPIPRSLALTAFGDTDISSIKTKPPGRQEIITHLAREKNEQKVYDRVRQELEKGRQAYFVYPLIAESEKLELKNAEQMYDHLATKIFPGFTAGIIHSKLSEDEKKSAMDRFQSGELSFIVATSVVEVGVDIPNATVMVIEHAERFGLSALHQLRGRVGRGTDQAYCFLVYSDNLTEDAVKRLKIMMETNDGFTIAEEDLKIRGPGALLGVQQSGFFKLTAADITADFDLLTTARDDVEEILAKDPGLLQEEHKVIRNVLAIASPFQGGYTHVGTL
ncbi:MAG: ATP-dependent DNA helicase RecG [Spirochaetales bacterium]|nr:ATP-dependent DNA helicase RecG [Spirochaetales bacterium]